MSCKIKEIMAGDGFDNAVSDLELSAIKVYSSKSFNIWWIPDYELDRITNISDGLWRNEWGFWRYADGCNIECWPRQMFTINGKSMYGWYHPDRDHVVTKYESLLSYLQNEIGASTPKNVCAVSVGLAELNGITMADLFKRYQE